MEKPPLRTGDGASLTEIHLLAGAAGRVGRRQGRV